MSKIIIDGYNAIYKIPEIRVYLKQSLQTTRGKFVQYLSAWKVRNHIRQKIYVVYDGQQDTGMDASPKSRGIYSHFSHAPLSADQYIINMLKQSKTNHGVIVITDDNSIRNHCRVYNAVIKPVAFLTHDKKVFNASSDEKTITADVEHDINNYLKSIWDITEK